MTDISTRRAKFESIYSGLKKSISESFEKGEDIHIETIQGLGIYRIFHEVFREVKVQYVNILSENILDDKLPEAKVIVVEVQHGFASDLGEEIIDYRTANGQELTDLKSLVTVRYSAATQIETVKVNGVIILGD